MIRDPNEGKQFPTTGRGPGAPLPGEEAPGIPLTDLLIYALRNRRFLIRFASIFMVLALVIALVKDLSYTATTKLIREPTYNESIGSRGLGAFSGLGALMGGVNLGQAGLTIDAYPTVLRSREVGLAVAYETYYFNDIGDSLTLYEYFYRPPSMIGRFFEGLKNVTIGLPRTLRVWLAREPDLRDGSAGGDDSLILLATEKEIDLLKYLRDILTVDVDRTSGVMEVTITTIDADLSAHILMFFISGLRNQIRGFYNERSKENLAFLERRLREAKEKLDLSEDVLASFVDRNVSPISARLRLQQDRLRRQVGYNSQLYGELYTQNTQVSIDLDKNRPVITVIERPMPPMHPSGLTRTLIMVLGAVLSVGLGFITLFLRDYMAKVDWREIMAGERG